MLMNAVAALLMVVTRFLLDGHKLQRPCQDQEGGASPGPDAGQRNRADARAFSARTTTGRSPVRPSRLPASRCETAAPPTAARARKSPTLLSPGRGQHSQGHNEQSSEPRSKLVTLLAANPRPAPAREKVPRRSG